LRRFTGKAKQAAIALDHDGDVVSLNAAAMGYRSRSDRDIVKWCVLTATKEMNGLTWACQARHARRNIGHELM